MEYPPHADEHEPADLGDFPSSAILYAAAYIVRRDIRLKDYCSGKENQEEYADTLEDMAELLK